jgi:hypothetical protein
MSSRELNTVLEFARGETLLPFQPRSQAAPHYESVHRDLVFDLKPWGYEDSRATPWKYNPGDGVHEFINGKLQFFIITDVEWDDINKTPKYKKVPDFRMKL